MLTLDSGFQIPIVRSGDGFVPDPRWLKVSHAERARVPDGLIAALRCQRQVDEDGAECGISRQAVDEAIGILEKLAAVPPQPEESE